MNKKKLKYLKSALASKKGAVFSSEIVIIILMVLVIAAIIITFIFTFINDKDKEIAEDIHSSYSELDQSNSSSDNTGNGGDEGGSLYETIPAGGVYKSGDKVYAEGEAFPEPQTGDIYSYGDYEYGYNMIKIPKNMTGNETDWCSRADIMNIFGGDEDDMKTIGWTNDANFWNVAVKDSTKKEYGPVLSSVGDKAVTSAMFSFFSSNVEKMPYFPDTITNASQAFAGCVNLKNVDYLPNSIIYCVNMFSGCTGIETVEMLPSNAKYLDSMFYNCTSLKSVCDLPSSAVNISSMFSNCANLANAPKLSNNIINMDYAFYKCSALTTPPPYIPPTVENIVSAFDSCSNLTGTIIIDANPSQYSYCFYATKKPIIITGKSTMLNLLAGWGTVTVQK